jgi:epoxyqueuosine reductase
MSSAAQHTAWVKQLAQEAGFLACGIATLRRLDEEEAPLKEWLQRGFHGKMQYMENHFEKRLDPRLILPGATHLVLFLYNYSPAEPQSRCAQNRTLCLGGRLPPGDQRQITQPRGGVAVAHRVF